MGILDGGVIRWSVEDVQDWLSQEGFGDYAELFGDHGVDGQFLLQFRQQTLRDIGVGPQETLEDLYGCIRALQDECTHAKESTLPQKRSASSSIGPTAKMSAKAPPKGPPLPKPSSTSVGEPPSKQLRLTESSKASESVNGKGANPPRSKIASGAVPNGKLPPGKPAVGKSQISKAPSASNAVIDNGQIMNAPQSKQPNGTPAPPKENRVSKAPSQAWYNAPKNPAALGPKPPSMPPPPGLQLQKVAGAMPQALISKENQKIVPVPKKPTYGLRPELMRQPAVNTSKLLPSSNLPQPSEEDADEQEENEAEAEWEEEQEEEEQQEAEEEEEEEEKQQEAEEEEEQQDAEEMKVFPLQASNQASTSSTIGKLLASASSTIAKDILVIDGLDLAQNVATNQGDNVLLNSAEVFQAVLEVFRWLHASQPESTLQAFLPRTLYSCWEQASAGLANEADIFRNCVTPVPSANISGALLQYITRKAKEGASIRLVSNSSYDNARTLGAATVDVCNNPIGYCFTPDGEFLCPDLPEPLVEPTLSTRIQSKPLNGRPIDNAPLRPTPTPTPKQAIAPLTPAPKKSIAPMTPPPKQYTIIPKAKTAAAKVDVASVGGAAKAALQSAIGANMRKRYT